MIKKYLLALALLVASVAHAGPTVRISAPTESLALNETTTVTVSFSEAVTGFTLSDMIIYGGGGEYTSALSGSGTTYTVGFRKTTPGPTSLVIDNNSYSPAGHGISFGFNKAPVIYVNSGATYSTSKVKAVPQPRYPYPGERLVTTATGQPATCQVEKYYVLEFTTFKKTWFYKEIPQKGLCRPTAQQSWQVDPAPKAWDAASVHGMHNHSKLMPKITNQEITRKTGTAKIRVRVDNHDCNRVNNQGHCDPSGAFRTGFESSHMDKDDPIVYPGQKGAAHHHTFYGNASVDYRTNNATLLKNCDSVAAGGVINCTGYWQPSMVDTATGTALDPSLGILVYYKAPPTGSSVGVVEPLPKGLRIIAGNPNATSDPNTGSAVTYDKISFLCLNRATGATYPGGGPHFIPSCKAPQYTELMASVAFPQCVADNGSGGMVLDSTNHRRHLANPQNPTEGTHTVTGTAILPNWCPTSHPHLIPAIQVNATFEIKQGQDTATWRLSSDNYSASSPGGYSLHADWWGMWRTEWTQRITDQCNNKYIDCGTNYVGLNDGIAISSITVSGTTATITTAQPHRLPIGDLPAGMIQSNFAGTKILGRISGITGVDASLYNFDPDSTLNSVVIPLDQGGNGTTRSVIPVGSQPLTVINSTQIQYTLSSTPTDTTKDGAEVSGAKLQWGESLCTMSTVNCPASYYEHYYPVN